MLLVATVFGTVNGCNCFIYAVTWCVFYMMNMSGIICTIYVLKHFSVTHIYVEGLHFLLLLIRECKECSVI